jgi:opacity protein-like surface antigen
MEKTMKKSLSLLAAFLVAGMWSAPVQAADHYVSGMAGMSWFQNMEADEALDGIASDEKDGIEYSFDSGLTVAAAIGCDYGSTRLEAEVGYQSNDVESIDFKDNGEWDDDAIALEGDVNVYSLMANGFYDIDLGGVELYAMAGVGIAQVNFDGVSDPDRSRQILEFNASETALAYQVGAGLALIFGQVNW